MYVVQKGDSGFWGIAQKHYGDGKYYYLIAKANPKVNSNSLQIGDKLVLPDKPASTTPVAGGAVTPAGPGTPVAPVATPLTAGPGQKLYTITKEDTTGLWGIAKKEYGNGAYWKIIAQANPTVNASAMKVGQQLIVPALTEEAKKAAGTIATQPRSPTAPAAKRTGVEDIGPTPKFR
jgi:nucleoid-associated protein YgaU